MSIEVMRMLQLAAHRDNVHRVRDPRGRGRGQLPAEQEAQGDRQLEESGRHPGARSPDRPGVSPETLEFVCYDNNNNEVKFLPIHEEVRPRRR